MTGLFIVYVKLLHPFNLHSKVYVHYCEKVRKLLKVIRLELERGEDLVTIIVKA